MVCHSFNVPSSCWFLFVLRRIIDDINWADKLSDEVRGTFNLAFAFSPFQNSKVLIILLFIAFFVVAGMAFTESLGSFLLAFSAKRNFFSLQ